MQILLERIKCQICKKWMEKGEECILGEFTWNGQPGTLLPIHIAHNDRKGKAWT